MNTITGAIESKEEKSGTGSKGDWTRVSYTINGSKYSQFNPEEEYNPGDKVSLTYAENDKDGITYKNIQHIEKSSEGGQGNTEFSQTSEYSKTPSGFNPAFFGMVANQLHHWLTTKIPEADTDSYLKKFEALFPLWYERMKAVQKRILEDKEIVEERSKLTKPQQEKVDAMVKDMNDRRESREKKEDGLLEEEEASFDGL